MISEKANDWSWKVKKKKRGMTHKARSTKHCISTQKSQWMNMRKTNSTVFKFLSLLNTSVLSSFHIQVKIYSTRCLNQMQKTRVKSMHDQNRKLFFFQPVLNHSKQISGSTAHPMATDWVIVKDRGQVDSLQLLSSPTYGQKSPANTCLTHKSAG